ncbi:MAG: GntR family transcriptional regulator [Coriobacteriaceae bacterium]|nr:GntR family transcriptional regulator [Coriobacteriaceae bacterium]
MANPMRAATVAEIGGGIGQTAGERASSAVGVELNHKEALYTQLASVIRERIYARAWTPRMKIPSEHALMAQFGMARGTVRKALKLLVDEGMLVQVRGSGTYVAEPGISHPAGIRPLSFAESLREQGQDFRTRVIEKRISPASPEVASELRIEEGGEAMFMRRVRTVHGEPIMCQESWLNIKECPGLFDVDYTQESLFDAVQTCAGRKVKTSHMRYMARVAGHEHGELLDCDESAALLLLEQTISLEDGVPVEWCSTWFKPGQSVVGTAVQPDESRA